MSYKRRDKPKVKTSTKEMPVDMELPEELPEEDETDLADEWPDEGQTDPVDVPAAAALAASLQSQVDATPSGGTLNVPAGTYLEGLYIGKPITLIGEMLANGKPGVILKPPSGKWNGIHVKANNVTIQGFDVSGAKGDGIAAEGVHHFKALKNRLHNNGESGLQCDQCDVVEIDGNECFGNAGSGWFSGISVYQCRLFGGTVVGFRLKVTNNICYANWTNGGNFTDGNGIIIDDGNSTQTGGFPKFVGPSLVENNLCYANGGKGIAIHWSDKCTVRKNTVHGNNGDTKNTATWRGDLSNQQSGQCIFEDNIALCDPATHASSTAIGFYGSATELAGCTWTRNAAWPANRAVNGNVPNLMIADPALVDHVPTNPAMASMGWRPVGATPPIEPPVEPPVIPPNPTLEARVAALEADVAGLRTVTAGLMVSVAEAKVEVQRLDKRLDDIGSAADD